MFYPDGVLDASVAVFVDDEVGLAVCDGWLVRVAVGEGVELLVVVGAGEMVAEFVPSAVGEVAW